MEPDHSANIMSFIKEYPDTVIVGNAKTFAMMDNFFEGLDLGDKKLIVKDGEKLSLGSHELTFVFAPMIHWPEVMMTYDSTDKVFFFKCSGCGRIFMGDDVDQTCPFCGTPLPAGLPPEHCPACYADLRANNS